MENYGSYQTRQLDTNSTTLNSRINKKENENKNEQLQKTVACTIGTLAGVGLASLIGYGIIKTGFKNPVNKTTEKIKQSAQKNIEKSKKVVEKKTQNILFKTLAKVKNGESVKKIDIVKELNTLQVLQKNMPKQSLVTIKNYETLLIVLLSKFNKDAKDEDELDNNDYKSVFTEDKIDSLNNNVFKIINSLDMTNKVNAKLNENGVSLNNFSIESNKLKINGNDLILNETIDNIPDNAIQLTNEIFVDQEAKNNINKNTLFYINSGESFYKLTLENISNALANPEQVNAEDILGNESINEFDRNEADIKDIQINGETFTVIKGVKDEDGNIKYAKIKDLSSQNINMILNAFENSDYGISGTGANFAQEVAKNISDETLKELINEDDEDLKNKLTDDDDGILTDAGNALLGNWIKKNQNDKDALANLLKGINDYDDQTIGAAFAKEVAKNISGETLKELINEADEEEEEELKNKLIYNDDDLTNAGNALLGNWIKKNQNDKDALANLLKGINDYGNRTIGAAFAKEVAEKIPGETLKELLKTHGNDLQEKLVNIDAGDLTNAGKIMLEAASTRLLIDDFKQIAQTLAVKEFTQDLDPKSIKIAGGILKVKPKTHLKDYLIKKQKNGEAFTQIDMLMLYKNAIDGPEGKGKIIFNESSIGLSDDDIESMIDSTGEEFESYESETLSDIISGGDMKQYLIDGEDNLFDTTKDSLKYLYGVDNVIEENSKFIKLLSKQRKDDCSFIIGGIKYKYYVDNDSIMYIRKARHQ